MNQETKKILSNEIEFSATCVRVPVFIGHSEAVNIEFHEKVSVEQAREAIKNAPGCKLLDEREDGGYVTPKECAGNDDTFISRIREDTSTKNGLSIWVVSDNLRKGAAAPFLKLSDTTQIDKPFLVEVSSLILEIKVSSLPAHSFGVTYPPSSRSSSNLQPGAFLIASLACSTDTFS